MRDTALALFQNLERFDSVGNMSVHTEDRIRQACSKAVAAKTDDEAERVLPELRSALRDHIRLAKVRLEEQASAVVFLDSKRRNRRAA